MEPLPADKPTQLIDSDQDKTAKILRRSARGRPRADRSAPAIIPVAEIAQRAYDRFLARGGEHGMDLDDWFHAERELHVTAESYVTDGHEEPSGSFGSARNRT
jgi:hypothetical protein